MLRTTRLITVACLAVLILPSSITAGRSKITLINNGYRNMLIAITDDVPKDENLLTRIVDVFTQMSAYLYQVTRKRAYLYEVTVLIPSTWSGVTRLTTPAQHESEGDSDIRIVHPKVLVITPNMDAITFVGTLDERIGSEINRPVVVKVTPCGQAGHFMYITPLYLTKPSVASEYGPYGKALVHSWSHFRYGVFDEYPSDELGNHFYASDEGTIEATRCSRDIKGKMYDVSTGKDSCVYNNGYPDKNCRFRDDKNQEHLSYGSLMYRQYLSFIDGFCDNDTSDVRHLHNPMSQSMQNIMCNTMSIWEVLRTHGDFDNMNPPRHVTNTTPVFRFVRQTPRRTVLVLDISDSMRKNNRIQKLRQAARLYLTDYTDDGELVGMVAFNQNARTISELRIINEISRDLLVNGIPSSVRGYTGIGGAILRGIKVLANREAATGGHMVLVTDGQENRSPSISSVTQWINKSGVIVNTIALSGSADTQLETIATLTGGSSFYYSENSDSNALIEAFVEISQRGKKTSKKRETLNSLSAVLDQRNRTLIGDVIIDSTLGGGTKFSIGYSKDQVMVTVRSPSGKVIKNVDPGYTVDKRFSTITVTPPNFQPGKWTYNITNSALQPTQRITVIVSSSIPPGENNPITAVAQWAKREVVYPNDIQVLYLAVSKGFAPILHATVTASLERPESQPIKLRLRDNGAGSDISKNDGVYSCYVTQFSKSGRYNVKITVNSSPITVFRQGKIVASGSGTSLSSTTHAAQKDVEIMDFQRNVAPGSFKLGNFTKGQDLIPPGRVTDLSLLSFDSSARIISLQWTAVGDNMDDGTAHRYELQMATNFTSIREGVGMELAPRHNDSTLSKPQSAGSVERFNYTITNESSDPVTYYFRIRVADGSDNWSQPSNIVSVLIQSTEGESTAGVFWPIIVGVVITVVLVVSIIVGVLLYVRHRRNKMVV